MEEPKSSGLPEDVVLRIRAEEHLRFAVRQELERAELERAHATDAQKSKTWQFLNSAFGLFLLTSVFVTGLGAFLNHHAQRAREGGKLVAEFDFRLRELDSRTAALAKAKDEDRGPLAVYVWRATVGSSDFQTTLPEYKNVPWVGIVEQLSAWGVASNHDEVVEALKQIENGGTVPAPNNYTTFPLGFLEPRSLILHKYSADVQQHIHSVLW
jgi:hypothetical protein